MKVQREDFLGRLQSVKPGITSEDIEEQTSCVVFQEGDAITYSGEVMCRMKSGLDESICGAIKAAPLIAVLEKMPEDEIDVIVTDNELAIKGKGRKAVLSMEAEILLGVSVVEAPTKWKPLHEDFDDALKIVSTCASFSKRDGDRFEVTCLHFAKEFIEACDAVQLCRYSIKTGLSKPFLIRRESLKEITTLGMTEFSESDAWMHFRNPAGLQFSCRRYLEDFTDLSEFLEVSGDPLTLPSGLAEAIETANIFAVENGKDCKVSVELKKGKLKLKGEGISGWYQELKAIKYTGKELRFLIAPSLLQEISKRHSNCEITADRLKVTGENFTYVSCLAKPDGDEEEASEEKKEES